jgi:hypothetical protein
LLSLLYALLVDGVNSVDGVNPQEQNIFVFRYPALALIGIFLATGPAPFQQAHVAAANRAWQRQAAAFPRPDSKIPLKHLPNQPPAHDSSTCAICIQLHAPMMAFSVALICLQPTARLGNLPLDPCPKLTFIRQAPQNCRGPPCA